MSRKQNSEYMQVVTAALLHDVGKFAQRAALDKLRQGDEKVYCPFNSKQQHFTHQHVLYTFGWLQSAAANIPKELDAARLADLAAMHHNPSTPLQSIIAQADRISAGSDRKPSELEKEPAESFRTQALQSVFCSVNLGKGKPQTVFHACQPFFPDQEGRATVIPKADISTSREAYAALWDAFAADWKKLQTGDFNVWLAALDSLLEHYTWCIPSSTIDEPDISLYDHSITTAAFAAATYAYHEAEGNLQDKAAIENRTLAKYLLVNGDLSGIQRYIFDLKTSKYNAKLLRARSFELQAVAENAAMGILQEAGLPHFCRITNAGGRFLLLLPNTEHSSQVLENWREKLDRWFLDRTFGELTLNLSEGIPASAADLQQTAMTALFRNLALDTARAKQQKLQHALLDQGAHMIAAEYLEIESAADVCPLCGKRKVRNHEEPPSCDVCKTAQIIGGRIPKARYLKTATNADGDTGLALPDGNTLTISAGTEQDGSFASINRFEAGHPLIRIPYHLPHQGDNILTFQELAEDRETGAAKLAMFKADLDNLGALFSSGMGKSVSISRYASMSRMLDAFFSTYVHDLIQEQFPRIYTVFSGGDDLCVLGPWDDVIAFAIQIRKELSKFTGNNPSLTISGGIALASPRLPVRYMADQAETALDAAKSTPDKNSVCLWGDTLSWDDAETALATGKQLYEKMTQGSDISPGLVYRLIGYGKRARLFEQGASGKQSAYNAMWRAHLMYDTARNGGKERDWLREIADQNRRALTIIAAYALYKHRKPGKGGKDE